MLTGLFILMKKLVNLKIFKCLHSYDKSPEVHFVEHICIATADRTFRGRIIHTFFTPLAFCPSGKVSRHRKTVPVEPNVSLCWSLGEVERSSLLPAIRQQAPGRKVICQNASQINLSIIQAPIWSLKNS